VSANRFPSRRDVLRWGPFAVGAIGLSSTLRGDPSAPKRATENSQTAPLRTGGIRIDLYQVICSAKFSENLDTFAVGLRRADREGVEIVCFPECFLTGCAHSASHAREVGISADSPKMRKALEASSACDATAVVGFGELRGRDYYNSAAVVHKGRLLGVYSKCTAYESWEKQGREFPVLQHGNAKFGVVICSDGGYIEPARILAAKGAKIIFAPHNNYIDKEYLLEHYRTVRSDHTARAVENIVYFVRGNNYVPKDPRPTGSVTATATSSTRTARSSHGLASSKRTLSSLTSTSPWPGTTR
jgi:predicted amidohydrolase